MAWTFDLTSLFEVEVAACHAAPRIVDEQLFPEERLCIKSAVPKRRQEFGTARLCARQSLAHLGIEPVAIAMNEDRSPAWPKGIVGSISHTQDRCGAVVAKSTLALGLGLDLERDTELSRDLTRMICTPRERSWLDRRSAAQRGGLAKVFFSAKESVYKCQYAVTGKLLDFQAVDLTLDMEAGTYRVDGTTAANAVWSVLMGIQGRVVRTQGLIATGASLAQTGQSRIRAPGPVRGL
jgi:4'-phosphopantetheinyl transferase EntD